MQVGMKRKVYPQLDVVKFCMAFLVVLIHTEPFAIVRGNYFCALYDVVLRLAVPFYFMTSGFLLGNKCLLADEASRNGMMKQAVVRNTRLYLIWSLIYLPAAIEGYIQEGMSFTSGAMRYLASLILVGEHFYSWPLWYLLAMIYGLIGIAVFCRKFGSKGTCLLSLGIFFVAHMIDGIYREKTTATPVSMLVGHMTEPLIVAGPARIMIGFFYMSAGWLLAEKKSIRWPLGVWTVLTIAAALLSAWFRWWPVALVNHLCFFMLVLKLRVSLRENWGKAMRRSSTVIYFTHMLFFFIWYLMNGHQETKGIAGTVWTLGWSAVACAIVLWSDRHERSQLWTKYLF